MKQRLFCLWLLLSAAVGLSAMLITYGELNYNITKSEFTAEVTPSLPLLFGSDYSKLSSVSIPTSVPYGDKNYSVTSIGESAFWGCTGLTSITIPNSVTSIGNEAFSGCSGLTSIIIPNSVTSIGDEAFSGCSGLTSITIPNSVTSIGNEAFSGCSGLTSITIPNSVTSIGNEAFSGCSGLTSVIVENGNQKYDSRNDCNAIIKTATNTLIVGCKNTTIPNSVTSIGDGAFSGCSGLTSITIPNSVTGIGDRAFDGCNIEAVVWNAKNCVSAPNLFMGDTIRSLILGDEVESIPSHFFSYQYGLDSVTIPNSVVQIGDSAFMWCSRTNFTFVSNTPPQCGMNSFDGARGKFIIPCWSKEKYRAALGDYDFVEPQSDYQLSVQSIDINCGSAYIAEEPTCRNIGIIKATNNYGYHFVQWNDGNTDNPCTIVLTSDTTLTAEFAKNRYSISVAVNHSDWGSAKGDTTVLYLDSVTLSATANYGYHFAYWRYYLGILSTANPLRVEVTKNTFYTAVFERNSYSITTLSANSQQGQVVAPFSAQYMDSITIEATPNHGYHFTQWSDGNTDNPRTITLTCDTALTAEFALTLSGQCGNALYWQYDNRTLTISGTGSMYDYSTDNLPWLLFCDTTEAVVVESGCTHIGDNAFYGLSSITKIELPGTTTSIGESAFANCSKLSSVYLPAMLNTIGANAFAGCRKLYDIYCYAAEPPVADNSSFANYNVNLYVPCDNLRDYQMDAVFGSFKYIQCMGAENTNTSDSISITPSTNDAVFIWRADETADTYILQITKDDEVFCTLVFNANGQLCSIAFAPSRNGPPAPRAAEQTATGFRFTVTGLNQKTHYAFEMKVKDKNDQLIQTYTGEFDTASDTPSSIDNASSAQDSVSKVVRDGQVLIIRGGKTYTATGIEVE